MWIGDERGSPEPSDKWRDYASCRRMEPDVFFPPVGAEPGSEEIRAAKTVCEGCPVRGACLQYALETNQSDGIWGGTTERERRKLRRSGLAGPRRRAG